MANKKSKKSNILIIIFALITLLTSAVALTNQAPKIRLALAKNGQVSDGVLPDVKSHISEVPDGEIRYLINKNMYFESPYSQGNVMLENPEVCDYDLKFSIYNADGDLIYMSPMLKAGQCLEKDKLSAVVKSGEYNCNYSAEAYKDGNLIGQVTGILKVTVG